jgi:ectoine hydroxylase-related dioxygenase (phytanoyl-CoA dioxygenase family)
MELSDEQVSAYRKRGFVRLGRVLDASTVAELVREEERFRLPVAYAPEGRGTLFVNIQLCHRSAPVRRVCAHGAHLQAVVQLLGPSVCLTHQQFVTKLPEPHASGARGAPGDIPLHQDDGYGRLEPMNDVTVWIPLVDTDRRNGGLVVVPGSHEIGLLDHGHAGVNPVLLEAASDLPRVPLALAAGEGVAFTGLTLHGSGPNLSSAARPAFFVRYCEPGARMMSEGGRPVLEDPHSWMVAGEA